VGIFIPPKVGNFTPPVTELKAEIGDAFSELGEVERLALVTARCEGCVNHGRLKEVTKEHPHDITVALHGPVGKGLLMSEGSGRSTFYYRPGRHPMAGGCSELPGSVRSRAPNIYQKASDI
jgi:hypothetical protein